MNPNNVRTDTESVRKTPYTDFFTISPGVKLTPAVQDTSKKLAPSTVGNNLTILSVQLDTTETRLTLWVSMILKELIIK